MTDYLKGGKLEYLTYKLKIDEKCVSGCNNKSKSCCNICWWKGVSKTPEEMIEKVCRNCTKDMATFKRLNDGRSNIEISSECSVHCLWWEFFDYQRKSICDQTNIVLVYKHK